MLDVAALYAAHHDEVCAYLTRRLPGYDRSVADDLTQEAFLLIWRKQDHYRQRPGVSPMAWVMTIVRHVLADHFRHEKRTVSLDERADCELEPAAPSRAADVEWTLLLNAALATLPDKQREAIEARYYRGIRDRELADTTTVGGAKKLRWRALANLRRALGAA